MSEAQLQPSLLARFWELSTTREAACADVDIVEHVACLNQPLVPDGQVHSELLVLVLALVLAPPIAVPQQVRVGLAVEVRSMVLQMRLESLLCSLEHSLQ